MIKKVICFLIFGFYFGNALAQEQSWAELYNQILKTYLYDTRVDLLGVAALKNLNKIDKNLQIGDDNSRVSLYYKGKLIKVLNKPGDYNDSVGWGELTEHMIDEAIKISPTVSEKDFSVEDVLGEGIASVLDKASKYYRSIDDADGDVRNHRVFAARHEEKFFYVKIKAFNKQTLNNLKTEFASFPDRKAVIFDLRGCNGGMAGAAIEAVDLFLNHGIICSIKNKEDIKETYFNAKTGDIAQGSPVFILIDEVTASAAEIFASALQEQSRAKVIGTLSKGKGTMQKLIPFPNGGILGVTNSLVYTPSGKKLDISGVVPDICAFERDENTDVSQLIKQKEVSCDRESRENKELELKIVEALLKK